MTQTAYVNIDTVAFRADHAWLNDRGP